MNVLPGDARRDMEDKEESVANRITVGFAFLLAALYLYATEQFPALQVSDPLGPKAFPRMLGAGLLLAALALLVETFSSRKSAARVAAAHERVDRGPYRLVAAVVVWIGLYVAAFEPLGYALSTTIFLAALMSYFRPRRWTGNMLTAVLYSFASYWMFSRLLAVSLPRGVLPF